MQRLCSSQLSAQSVENFQTWDLLDHICWLLWHFIQQPLVLQLPGLPDLFHCPCTICVVMFIDISPTLSTSL